MATGRCEVAGASLLARDQAVAEQDQKNGNAKEQRADHSVQHGERHHRGHRLRILRSDQPRPVGAQSKQDLRAKNGVQQDARFRDGGGLFEAPAQDCGGPDEHAHDDQRAHHVRPHGNVFVAETGAEDDLEKDDHGVDDGQGVNRRRAGVFDLRLIGKPPAAGKYGNAQQRGENDLSEAGVHHRQPVMQQLADDFPAENGLREDA